AAEWDQAIIARCQAAFNCDFAGYLSYAWGSNTILDPESQQIHFMNTYYTQNVLHTEVHDSVPPGPVTLLTAAPGVQQITLSWKNPSSGDFTGVMIRRQAGRVPARVPDGTLVVGQFGTPGATDRYIDAGLAPGTHYGYALYAH